MKVAPPVGEGKREPRVGNRHEDTSYQPNLDIAAGGFAEVMAALGRRSAGWWSASTKGGLIAIALPDDGRHDPRYPRSGVPSSGNGLLGLRAFVKLRKRPDRCGRG